MATPEYGKSRTMGDLTLSIFLLPRNNLFTLCELKKLVNRKSSHLFPNKAQTRSFHASIPKRRDYFRTILGILVIFLDLA